MRARASVRASRTGTARLDLPFPLGSPGVVLGEALLGRQLVQLRLGLDFEGAVALAFEIGRLLRQLVLRRTLAILPEPVLGRLREPRKRSVVLDGSPGVLRKRRGFLFRLLILDRFDDGTGDFLTGNLGRDAFFANLDAGVTDLIFRPTATESQFDVD